VNGIDIDEVRRWFGDGWRVNSRRTEYEHAEHTLIRIGCDPCGWYYVVDMICVAAECNSLRELAAKARAWHLEQAREIRLGWTGNGGCPLPGGAAYDLRGHGLGFSLETDDLALTLTTDGARVLRDWLDQRLAMAPPSEGDE